MTGGGGDSRNYLQMAENLKNHGVLSLASTPPFTPSTINVPGYPLFVLALKSVFGSYIAVTGPTSYFRYRLPADPFIIISALAGLSFLIDLLRNGFLPRKS